MKTTRRQWLRLAGFGTFAAIAGRGCTLTPRVAPNDIELRIAELIAQYEAQGFHRTATAVDEVSGRWLADQVRQAGLSPALESFPVDRVDPQTTTCTIADRTIQGLPLFDGAFTSPEGVRGRLGHLDTDAPIGLIRTPPGRGATGTPPDLITEAALEKARRENRHRAIIAVTIGNSPGLCPRNATSFRRPFGPPVLQVSSDEWTWLDAQAKHGSEARVVAHVNRTAASAHNVTAEHRGTAPSLGPVVIMTPRSGWYTCASERAGLACWLEIMRNIAAAPTRRSVLFVASSGHELGHLGIDDYIARREGIIRHAAAWLHLGANIGAAKDPRNVRLQFSDDALHQHVRDELKAANIHVAQTRDGKTLPSGEAENVYRGGGRYASVLSANLFFHNIKDRGPEAINPQALADFSRAFTSVTRTLCDR